MSKPPVLLCTLALLAGVSSANPTPAPATPMKPVDDLYHGVKVVDAYRWLEDSKDPAVKAWSDAQNVRARAYLDSLPCKEELGKRISALIRSSSVSYGVHLYRAGLFFAIKNDPSRQQPLLVTLGSADDVKTEKVLLDPNVIDPTGHTAMDWFVVSHDGTRVGVSLSTGGSESGDLHLYEVATGRELPDVIAHVQNGTAGGSIAFAADDSGFWYTRYPRTGERPAEDAGFYQQVWYHRIGDPVADDTYELGQELPRIAEILLATQEDRHWVLAEVKNGDGGEVAYYLRPTARDGAWEPISTFADKIVGAQFGTDDALYLMSRMSAPKGKILRLPLPGATHKLAAATLLVPESDGAIQGYLPTDHRLYVKELLGGPSRVRVFDLSGKQLSELPLLPVSTAGGLVRLPGDDILFMNGSYLQPPAWYHFDARSGKSRPTALAITSIADFSDCEVVRELVVSTDGTKVPLNIIKRKGTPLDGNNPAILYAYGGYGVSVVPDFSAPRRAWIEQGGIYATANIRGGGEYGDSWHLDGNLLKKQNGFDDFYACAKWLCDSRHTSPARLAILGGSNGGLLMGASLTQHPEQYRAVVSLVGVYDMLRVELTANGAFNVTEYGTVKDPAQFKALYGYSPLHRVVDGTKYPSILLTTGANDPRVDPWHSRKLCARLQAADTSGHPILLRTSSSAGHGMGSSLDEIIAEKTHLFAFLFNELGVEYKPVH
jgi:prolyl oligopeptidase